MAGPDNMLAAAWRALQDRQLEDAERLSQYVTQSHPSYPAGWFLLGVACLRQHRAADALTYLQQAERLRPDFADVYLHLGNAYRELGRLGEAEQSYRHTVKL